MAKVYEFSAAWCGPCKAFANTIKKASELDKFKDVDFRMMDIEEDDDAPDLVAKYRVMSVPTVVITDDNGNELGRTTGNVPLTVLEKEIDKALDL